jgi:hypothetical protein
VSALPSPSSASNEGPAYAGLLFFALACVALGTHITLGAAEVLQTRDGARPLHILFIGNSLTASNDLPAMVAALAAGGGHARPQTRALVVGGFSLEDHWNKGDAQKVIAGDNWNVVVLQQGPSALMESRRLLIEYARRFAEVIRTAGATPALYAVWPSVTRRGDFNGVSASYTAAARAVNGKLLPAGDAWGRAMRAHPDLALYSEDGLHPTRAGTYLAALVIYRELYAAPVNDLPALGLPAEDAARLKAAVP